MYMVFHISAALGFYMYTVLYIVIYALCTHISCTNLPPSCWSNIPLPSGQEILVATAAFLLCGSCMRKFRILYTKSYSLAVMIGASRTNYLTKYGCVVILCIFMVLYTVIQVCCDEPTATRSLYRHASKQEKLL